MTIGTIGATTGKYYAEMSSLWFWWKCPVGCIDFSLDQDMASTN